MQVRQNKRENKVTKSINKETKTKK